MSFDAGSEASARCDGKGCRDRYLGDGDAIYCEDCAGMSEGRGQGNADAVRAWLDANGLNLDGSQYQLVESIIESMDSGVPLVLVRRAA